MSSSSQFRSYIKSNSVVFRMTSGLYGGLSNMAPGFPVRVNGIRINTVEALYQACRFPHLPNIQKMIIDQASPMTAKMRSKPYRGDSRKDWDRVRVKIMRWCLRVKLAQNSTKFGQLLLSTGSLPIVEESRKDSFWGAKPSDDGGLFGMNILGRLLMELREEVQSGIEITSVEPLSITNFSLFGEPILEISSVPLDANEKSSEYNTNVVKKGRQLPLIPKLERNTGVRTATAALRPYQDYKTSGPGWLATVPSHWQLLRAKYLFHEVDERSVTGKEELLSVSHLTGVTPRSQKTVTMFLAKSNVGHKVCRPDDVVINTMWAWMGALGVARHTGIVSPSYGVYRPKSPSALLSRYADNLLRTPLYVAEYLRRSTGVNSSRLRLYPEHFLRTPVVIPPPKEQAAIVRFLEHANGWISRAIRAKRKFISLLTEQKRLVIHQVINRGVDPNIPLRASGMASLGEIPMHWEVSRVKNEFRCLNRQRLPLNSVERGKMTSRLYDYYGASGVIDKVDDFLFDDELLLIAEDGANLILRNLPLAIIARGKFWVNNHAHILKPRRGNIEYLAYLMEDLNYLPWISGAAQPKLTQDRLMSISISVAPLWEQDAIVEHISKETQPIAKALERAKKEIALLREYRTRLIFDVVTGQLDVRAMVEHLPAVIEKLEVDAGEADLALELELVADELVDE